MSKEKHLDNGWTWDRYAGALVHFRHIPLTEAEALEPAQGQVWIVETINGTFSADMKHLHHNCYFAIGLPDALALASSLELTFRASEIAETVIGMRVATHEESDRFWAAFEVFTATEPVAYRDREVQVWAAARGGS